MALACATKALSLSLAKRSVTSRSRLPDFILSIRSLVTRLPQSVTSWSHSGSSVSNRSCRLPIRRGMRTCFRFLASEQNFQTVPVAAPVCVNAFSGAFRFQPGAPGVVHAESSGSREARRHRSMCACECSTQYAAKGRLQARSQSPCAKTCVNSSRCVVKSGRQEGRHVLLGGAVAPNRIRARLWGG
jgi:hypothetical protein